MDAFPIPILSDNYVWCLHNPEQGTDAIVVDPGEAGPVRDALAERGLQLRGILVTHWHPDHIGGIPDLLGGRTLPVYGPAAEAARIPVLTHPLQGGERLALPVGTLDVLAIPGHTLGHLGYLGEGWMFCGDTLFSAGCGRLFEGTATQMHASLQRLAQAADDTRIACTHEYTLANLRFARAVEPDNAALAAYTAEAETLRAHNRPTLPSTLAREKAINPFLRCDQPAVRAAVARHSGESPIQPAAVFTALRHWKDQFR